MEITLNIRNTENIDHLDDHAILKLTEIMEALVSSGGLTGVRGGSTSIHFDGKGVFQQIQLNYYPWKRRK